MLLSPNQLRICISVAILATAGCIGLRTEAPEVYIPNASSVPFDLEPGRGSNGSTLWKAKYISQGKVATFSIQLERSEKVDSSPDLPMTTGLGRFIAEEGSDASVLLADLQKAMGAKMLPRRSSRSARLPFQYVNLGDGQSQS